MSIDFSLVFIIAALVCGVIWGLDALVFSRSREAMGDQKEPILVEYARSFFPIIVIVLLFRSFLFEPFRIPSESMLPTLLKGDFILVNKYSYGLRWPVINKKFLNIGEPNRGDVVVFRNPITPEKHYIKRLVGLPGDTIRYEDKRLIINGEPVSLSLENGAPVPLSARRCNRPGRVQAKEVLGQVDHGILLCDRYPKGHGTEFKVPQGHYFMMGDNRDNSQDSRFEKGVGYVPESHLVGKAVRIWMHWGSEWTRIGNKII